MAKPESTQATETLHEIDSVFDRLASWVTHHPVAVLGGLGVILALAASIGGYRAWSSHREAEASAEVALVASEYLRAMGAQPGQTEVPEPANAEAALATRREYAQRFSEVAEREDGTRAGVAARLEAADLYTQLGDYEAALAAIRAAVAAAPRGSTLAALAQSRLGSALEAKGESAAAAEAYLAAGSQPDYPGRVLALGDAARSFADAGEPARALEVFGQLTEDEISELPVYVAARLRELRASTAAEAPAVETKP